MTILKYEVRLDDSSLWHQRYDMPHRIDGPAVIWNMAQTRTPTRFTPITLQWYQYGKFKNAINIVT